MTGILKLISVIIVFLIVVLFIKTIFSIITGLESWLINVLSLGCAALTGWYTWCGLSGKNMGVAAAILSGALILGGFGFIFGFLGPMLVLQNSQQATTIGVFVASPLGVVLGAIAGFFLATRKKSYQ